MDAKEIAKALTEAVIQKVNLDWVTGPNVSRGNAEKLGNKVGELYKGILTGVLDAVKSVGEKESK